MIFTEVVLEWGLLGYYCQKQQQLALIIRNITKTGEKSNSSISFFVGVWGHMHLPLLNTQKLYWIDRKLDYLLHFSYNFVLIS